MVMPYCRANYSKASHVDAPGETDSTICELTRENYKIVNF